MCLQVEKYELARCSDRSTNFGSAKFRALFITECIKLSVASKQAGTHDERSFVSRKKYVTF